MELLNVCLNIRTSCNTHLVPYSRLNRYWVELGIGLEKPSIHLLAFGALLNEIPNLIIHILPVESAEYFLDSLVSAKVATYSHDDSSVHKYLHMHIHTCYIQYMYAHGSAVAMNIPRRRIWGGLQGARLTLYVTYTCRSSVARLQYPRFLFLCSRAHLPWFTSSSSCAFPVVQDSILDLEVIAPSRPSKVLQDNRHVEGSSRRPETRP